MQLSYTRLSVEVNLNIKHESNNPMEKMKEEKEMDRTAKGGFPLHINK